jgi:hypothetical protein
VREYLIGISMFIKLLLELRAELFGNVSPRSLLPYLVQDIDEIKQIVQ